MSVWLYVYLFVSVVLDFCVFVSMCHSVSMSLCLSVSVSQCVGVFVFQRFVTRGLCVVVLL